MPKSLKTAVLTALDNLKAKDVNTLEVKDFSDVTDEMIIATGTSTTHVKAIAESVVEEVKNNSYTPIGVEGESGSEWILIDLGDIVVHVMMPQARDFYALEKMWAPINLQDDMQELAAA